MDAKTLTKPITDKELSAFLKSQAGNNQFVKRMAETLRQCWALLDAPPESTVIDDAAQAEADWQSHERVLVVSDVTGCVEIFGESWVAMRHVELKPWEDRDTVLEGLPEKWRNLDFPNKSKLLIVPQVRPELTDARLVELVLWSKRAETIERLAQWKANREKPVT